MSLATKQAWSIAEQYTPMFRIRFEAERGAEGPDEQELSSWLTATTTYGHASEDAGMYAAWLAKEFEAAYTGAYDCVVTYRVAYTDKKANGVRIVRHV